MKRRFLLLITLAVSAFPVFGQVFPDGTCKGFAADECAIFQRARQKEAAEKAAQQLQYQSAREADAVYQKTLKDKQDAQNAAWAEMRAKEKLEQDARRAAYEKERTAEDKAQASADRRAAAAVDVQKARCGDDYKAPKIGMSIDRVKACVTTVKLTGQLNRADGVVSTYEGGNAYFHVMDGRLVSWGKY